MPGSIHFVPGFFITETVRLEKFRADYVPIIGKI
jgi:hypothetical protein